MGQLLSLPMVVVGVVLFYLAMTRDARDEGQGARQS
jgi:prolipoprotein diacylglyceryltransferase